MKSLLKTTLLLGVGAVITASSAMGAFTYSNGDLILGFQATGGTGSNQNVFFNLGSGTVYRDNPSVGIVGNISTTLSSVYGANWYSRTDLWFGVIGNLNAGSPTGGASFTSPVGGDPSRTFYLSTPTATVGGGLYYAGGTFASSSLGNAGTTLGGMEDMLPGLTVQLDGAAILNEATQPVQWNNGWSERNPFIQGGQDAAFTYFTGGIQQNFGKATDSTYVDLQRVLASNTGANPAGIVGGGTYETTFAIGSDGSISAIPEPSAALLGGLGALSLLRRRRSSNSQ